MTAITVDQLLLMLAAEAARRGQIVERLTDPATRQAADRLLRVAGVRPATPPPALTASVGDQTTTMLPVYDPRRHR